MHISNDIRYIGVNDHQIDLFEGQYIVPNGMAYNSYVIMDEKIAVLDTVDQHFGADWFANLEKELDGRQPDYLVVHHMEPDHSANIAVFMETYPEAQIVSSAKAFVMMQQFFGTDFPERKVVVGEGSTLELGRHTLTFVTAPMVHWPETMMTFDETEGVLFSGDGFGCFGTLDGGFLDTRINTDRYWDEMVRYYSNIVGKYGSPVQKALQKLGGLHITTICSTHGPVWTDNISKVIGIYDKLSRYAADEGVVIAYGSMYGHTEQMAEAIAAELSAQGIKNIVMHNVSKSNPSYIIADIFKYRGLIIGSPTYSNQHVITIHAQLSPRHIFLFKGFFPILPLFVKRHTDNRQSIIPVAFVKLFHLRNCPTARTTPRCPEINQCITIRMHELRQLHLFPRRVYQFDIFINSPLAQSPGYIRYFQDIRTTHRILDLPDNTSQLFHLFRGTRERGLQQSFRNIKREQ